MKKLAVILVLIFALVGAGFAGVAAASAGHQPVTRTESKLVGFGPSGQLGGFLKWSWFTITNPNCKDSVTVKRASILGEDGTLVYEGPLYRVVLDANLQVVERELVTALKPHETLDILLHYWMPGSNPGEWMDSSQALALPLQNYTVEVVWNAGRMTLPLIGYSSTAVNSPSGHARTSVPMVNFP